MARQLTPPQVSVPIPQGEVEDCLTKMGLPLGTKPRPNWYGPRKFKDESELGPYLAEHDPLQWEDGLILTTLGAVVASIIRIVSREGMYDPQNTRMLICGQELEALLNARVIHLSQLMDRVSVHLITLPGPLHPNPYGPDNHPEVPKMPLTPPIYTSLSPQFLESLGPDTVVQMKGVFRRVLETLPDFPRGRVYFLYGEFSDFFVRYFLLKYDTLVDRRNTHVILVDQDPLLSKAFPVKAFFTRQLPALLRLQIKPTEWEQAPRREETVIYPPKRPRMASPPSDPCPDETTSGALAIPLIRVEDFVESLVPSEPSQVEDIPLPASQGDIEASSFREERYQTSPVLIDLTAPPRPWELPWELPLPRLSLSRNEEEQTGSAASLGVSRSPSPLPPLQSDDSDSHSEVGSTEFDFDHQSVEMTEFDLESDTEGHPRHVENRPRYTPTDSSQDDYCLPFQNLALTSSEEKSSLDQSSLIEEDVWSGTHHCGTCPRCGHPSEGPGFYCQPCWQHRQEGQPPRPPRRKVRNRSPTTRFIQQTRPDWRERVRQLLPSMDEDSRTSPIPPSVVYVRGRGYCSENDQFAEMKVVQKPRGNLEKTSYSEDEGHTLRSRLQTFPPSLLSWDLFGCSNQRLLRFQNCLEEIAPASEPSNPEDSKMTAQALLQGPSILSVAEIIRLLEQQRKKGTQFDRCYLCQDRPRNSGLVHGRIIHQISCYPCAKRLIMAKQPCPVCRRPVEKVCEII